MTSTANPSTNDTQANGTKDSPIHGLGLTMAANSSKENLPHQSPDRNGHIGGAVDPTARAGFSSAPSSAVAVEIDAQDIDRSPLFSSRNRQRLSTVKSAFLIYFALLGLSPILKSLTKSTASDSIWAMSCWLLIMNIFSFDYGSGEGAGATTKFPASLSTNAAVMASTVLASRLPSTTHVFSLMMLSIADTTQYYQLLLAQGISSGLGSGLLLVPALSVQSHHWRKKRALAMGIVLMGSFNH